MNIKIIETYDMQLIRSVITNPGVWPGVSDDQSPFSRDFQPPLGPRYVAAWSDDAKLVGCFALVPVTGVTCEVHTCLLPEHGGRVKLAAGAALLEWLWTDTNYLRLITRVPAYNRAALWFSKRLGLKQFGIDEKSIMKKGELRDVHMLGVSKCR